MGETAAVTQAKKILRGKRADPKDALNLVRGELKAQKAFDYARKVLERVRTDPSLKDDTKLALKIGQQQALCTYKDQNLSPETKFHEALKILDEVHREHGESLGTTHNQETLGQAGAINKYRWETTGQKHFLEESLNYYLRGQREGVVKDYGYTAVNAAFVLDLLASLESAGIDKASPTFPEIERRRDQAREIREQIMREVPPLADVPGEERLDTQWWFPATLGESCFGLGRYEESAEWFEKGMELANVQDWEKESTTRQLASLARIQFGEQVWKPEFENSPAGRALKALVGRNALRGMLLGKVGLALSGGGFRASFFHIGVLARLAELDMLRHVEVLSCVSGGSIIGAHYYLELRKLLNNTTDDQVERSQYIEIVGRVARQFLEGVQRNIRTRVAAEFLTNLKMAFKPGYSRTLRVGELYEEELYSKVEDGEGERPRFLSNAFIHPPKEGDTFSPKLHNWRREAKVPMLILNATALNTGHNWQFTASWMGEPPASINAEIDANYRLRRMYYSEAPPRYKNMRLGYAVAASSCVPGLFEPIAFPGLYPKEEPDAGQPQKMTVRLVDGGVHDNQGIASLVEQSCSVILVSDASGQMEAQTQPSRNLIGVPLRSNSVLQTRVRDAQHRELEARKESESLRGLMFVHLKKDLDASPVDWLTCQDPPEAKEERRDIARRRPLTYYGIQKDIQRSLADIRTDLDSFSQAEAYALMLSGYLMTEHDFPRTIVGYPSIPDEKEKWDFLALEQAMAKSLGHEAEHAELKRLLEVGSVRAFKIWALSKPLKVVGSMLGLAGFLALLWAAWQWFDVSLLSFGGIAVVLVVLIASMAVGRIISRIVRLGDAIVSRCIGVGMSIVGWLVARLHLHLFDPIFKNYGEISALQKRAGKRG